MRVSSSQSSRGAEPIEFSGYVQLFRVSFTGKQAKCTTGAGFNPVLFVLFITGSADHFFRNVWSVSYTLDKCLEDICLFVCLLVYLRVIDRAYCIAVGC